MGQLNSLEVNKFTKRGLIYEILDQDKYDSQFEFGWRGALLKLTASSRVAINQPDSVSLLAPSTICSQSSVFACTRREKLSYKLYQCQCGLKDHAKMFRRLKPDERHQLSLKDQIKIGQLIFEFNRYITGSGVNICHRKQMEDYICIRENLKISKIHFCNAFLVADGHGGWECAKFVADNLLPCLEKELMAQNLDELSDVHSTIFQAV